MQHLTRLLFTCTDIDVIFYFRDMHKRDCLCEGLRLISGFIRLKFNPHTFIDGKKNSKQKKIVEHRLIICISIYCWCGSSTFLFWRYDEKFYFCICKCRQQGSCLKMLQWGWRRIDSTNMLFWCWIWYVCMYVCLSTCMIHFYI